jgi:hypothetical protein
MRNILSKSGLNVSALGIFSLKVVIGELLLN